MLLKPITYADPIDQFLLSSVFVIFINDVGFTDRISVFLNAIVCMCKSERVKRGRDCPYAVVVVL